MAKQTDVYKLVRPELTDAADITGTDVNWTTIENELKKINLNITNHTNAMNELESDLLDQLSELENTVTNQGTRITEVRTELVNSDNTIKNQITTEVGKLQPKITYGESAPSGGNNGDIYIQII